MVWEDFPELFVNALNKHCAHNGIGIGTVKIVRCNHNEKPAWAQNDAMMEAYIDGMDYSYRINDDTLFLTPGWTEMFIHILLSFDPPNVGVVGPNHEGGNTNILTYDFTSSRHIEIFGYHYPKMFMDWSAGTHPVFIRENCKL